MILVSACLAGILCKYNGTYNNHDEIIQLVNRGEAVPVCPELLGGGKVPRDPNEITGGDGYAVIGGRARVKTPSGVDCTDMFVRGAEKVLDTAIKLGVKAAVLKERSPSCGSSCIYDGTFSGKKIPGCGVTTALLRSSGIIVYSEENFSKGVVITEKKKATTRIEINNPVLFRIPG